MLHDEGGLETFSPEPVSLAAVVASDQVLQWFECVAIVQVLCRALAEPTRVVGEAELSAASVSIDLSGNVSFAGQWQDGHEGTRQLAGLLHSILSDDVPVPLRLAISQALSSPPFYASVTEFSGALDYFERPNRNGIIQDVYRRWEQREQPEPQAPKRERPAIKEPVRKSPQLQTARARSPRRAVLVTCAAAAGVVFVISAAMMVLEATNAGPQATLPDPPRLSVPSFEIISSADTDLTLEGSPHPAKAPTEAVTTQPAAPILTNRVRAEVQQAPAAQASRTLRAQPSSASPRGELPQAPWVAPQPTAIIAQPVSAVVARPAAIDRTATAAIYSETDTDVVPPVAVYPHFLGALLERAHPDATSFDIVIGRTGSVQSVKLRQAPRTVGNAFHLTTSLSAAKAWRFQPALKDGQPVSYRKTIWLPPTP